MQLAKVQGLHRTAEANFAKAEAELKRAEAALSDVTDRHARAEEMIRKREADTA